MNINPIIILISQVISLYTFILVIYCIGSWLISFNILNKDNKLVYKIMEISSKITDPILSKIRDYVPNFAGLDLSPIILYLILNFIRNVLFTYFYIK